LSRPIELGSPFVHAEPIGALLAGMQIVMLGNANLWQAFRNRTEALLDDRSFAIAGEIGMQMIVVWIHRFGSFFIR
jgi:hypothetical protein